MFVFTIKRRYVPFLHVAEYVVNKNFLVQKHRHSIYIVKRNTKTDGMGPFNIIIAMPFMIGLFFHCGICEKLLICPKIQVTILIQNLHTAVLMRPEAMPTGGSTPITQETGT